MSGAAAGAMLSQALSRAARLLARGDAAAAIAEAESILAEVPGQQQALMLLISAYRLGGDIKGARTALEEMARSKPDLASLQYELGQLLAAVGLHGDAIEHLSKAVELEPNHPSAWRVLGNALASNNQSARAAGAWACQIRSSLRELKLLEDAAGGDDDQVAKAEQMLRQSLTVNPTDIMTIRMLAQREVWLGHYRAAGKRLESALRLLPDFAELRQEYAFVLQQELKWREAIAQFDLILAADPDNAICASLKAWNLVMLGEYAQAFEIFERITPQLQNEVPHWVNYGHALRTVGRQAEAIEAYKKVLELEPGFGLTWWSLANLKTYRFGKSEIEIMRTQFAREDLSDENRCHLAFALATALEGQREFPESFQYYRTANALRRPRLQHDPAELADRVARSKSLFTREFFRVRSGHGCAAPDPIFIVGMPRAGSTLLEQILSSHPAVEGTAELPDIPIIVAELKTLRQGIGYPEVLGELDAAALRSRGEQYLETTRHQRKLARPYFTDKAPLNFQHVGLIHLMLPNAKIIDARRHPMACCFSGYKQCFHMGSMPHTYDLTELGLYYRHYVELMAHCDRVLPGRVHRVFHENMVRDPETEIRRLLAYCGLPFDEACLRFYETDRGVRTSSSEQVRRPIFAPAVEPWRNYEEWLGPMKDALGDVLTLYPEVPEF